MAKKNSHLRKGLLFTWLILVVLVLIFYAVQRDWLDVNQLRDFVDEYYFLTVALYLLILTLIGLLLIPSTPFAVGGVLLFSPWEAYVFNLVGIISSVTVAYYFTRFLGLPGYFEEKYPQKIKKISKALQEKELPVIVGWSFFPFVPTDLIVYVSSTLKVHVWKVLLGVFIGEGLLNAFYIFFADHFV